MMTRKNKILLGAGGGVALLAAAGLAFAAPDGPQRFAAADLDRDGQVAAAEIQQVARQRFAAFDVNGDGSIAGAELELMHETRSGRGGWDRHRGDRQRESRNAGPDAQAAPAPKPATVQQAAAPQQARPGGDFDGDGAISLAEFQRRIATRYMLLDTDGNGTVSAEELKAVHEGRGGRGRR